MKFSAAGGWMGGKDWYENIRIGARYGFDAVEQLGWAGLDLAKAKATLEECGVVSTCLIIESVKHPEYNALAVAASQ
jgi:hypothetical protein